MLSCRHPPVPRIGIGRVRAPHFSSTPSTPMCMHTCTHVHAIVHAHMHPCALAHPMHMCTCTCTQAHMHMLMCTSHTHACTCTCMHAHVHRPYVALRLTLYCTVVTFDFGYSLLLFSSAMSMSYVQDSSRVFVACMSNRFWTLTSRVYTQNGPKRPSLPTSHTRV